MFCFKRHNTTWWNCVLWPLEVIARYFRRERCTLMIAFNLAGKHFKKNQLMNWTWCLYWRTLMSQLYKRPFATHLLLLRFVDDIWWHIYASTRRCFCYWLECVIFLPHFGPLWSPSIASWTNVDGTESFRTFGSVTERWPATPLEGEDHRGVWNTTKHASMRSSYYCVLRSVQRSKCKRATMRNSSEDGPIPWRGFGLSVFTLFVLGSLQLHARCIDGSGVARYDEAITSQLSISRLNRCGWGLLQSGAETKFLFHTFVSRVRHW